MSGSLIVAYVAFSVLLGLAVAVFFVNDEEAMKNESAPGHVMLFGGMWLFSAVIWPIFVAWIVVAVIFLLVKKVFFGPLPPKAPR